MTDETRATTEGGSAHQDSSGELRAANELNNGGKMIRTHFYRRASEIWRVTCNPKWVSQEIYCTKSRSDLKYGSI